MQIVKLIYEKGRQIERPFALEGTVSWSQKGGQAHAWAADGKTCLAEMVNARVVYIGPAGLRLEKMEPANSAGNRLRAQAWQLIF